MKEKSHVYDYDVGPNINPCGAVLLTLAAGACRLVIGQLAKDKKWPPGQWAFDGRKNIYTPKASLPREERSYQVRL